jgi:putative chitinase
MYDDAKFCAALTHVPFRLGEPLRAAHARVILDAAARHDPSMDLRFLAYEFATALWETEFTLLPIREFGEGRGHPYGLRDPSTGQVYYGRGYVQTTWKANYEKLKRLLRVDVVADPDLLLEPQYAAPAMFAAMEQGLYTGKKLKDYFNAQEEDPLHARRIINGLDRAEEIAGLYWAFKHALTEAKVPA